VERQSRLIGSFVLVIVACLVSAGVPARAVPREPGAYWTYGLTTIVALDLASVEVNGSVTYRSEGEHALVANGVETRTNVMAVEGELDGSSTWMGQQVQAHVLLEGWVYESLASAGTVKKETSLWVSGSIGSGGFAVPVDLETRNTETYYPGWLAEFHPDETLPGDSWTEVVLVDSATVTKLHGTVVESSERSFSENLTVSVSHFVDTLGTPAGEFDALELTVTTDRGTTDVYWWSDEVGGLVRHEAYENGSTVPSLTMILEGFGSTSGGGNMLVVVLVGATAAFLASVVLVFVLVAKRRPPKDS